MPDTITLTPAQTAAMAPTTDGSVYLFTMGTPPASSAVLLSAAAAQRTVNMAIARTTSTTRADAAPVTAEDLRALATAVGARSDIAQKQVIVDLLNDAASRGALTPRAFAAISYVLAMAAATSGTVTGPESVGVNKDTTFPPLGTVATGAATVGTPIVFSALPPDKIISALGSPLGDNTAKMVWPWWTVWALSGGALLIAIALVLIVWRVGKNRNERAQLEAPGRAIGQLPRGTTITVARK